MAPLPPVISAGLNSPEAIMQLAILGAALYCVFIACRATFWR